MKFRMVEELSTLNFGIEFVQAGRAHEKHVSEKDVDPAELEKGIMVELEHTTNKEIAKKIAMDHLSEIADYYTRLKKMEDDAKSSPNTPTEDTEPEEDEESDEEEESEEDEESDEEEESEESDEEGDSEEEEEEEGEITEEQIDKIINYVKTHDHLDDDFHKFAEELGIDPHEAEEVVYQWANAELNSNSLKV
jgi:hypothetical protein